MLAPESHVPIGFSLVGGQLFFRSSAVYAIILIVTKGGREVPSSFKITPGLEVPPSTFTAGRAFTRRLVKGTSLLIVIIRLTVQASDRMEAIFRICLPP
jgi:hypothetical protein